MHTLTQNKPTLTAAAPKQVPLIQPKLMVNAPGDRYEQEADAMAERVMRMPESKPQPLRPTATGLIARSIQRKCAACEAEEEKKKKSGLLMRKTEGNAGGFAAPPALVSQLNATKGGGSPLPEGTRSFMENAFSADFSGVRVHTDGQAAEMSKGIQAKAFTYGRDIYFNRGQFAPESGDGKRLLAHELGHVVQGGVNEIKFPLCRQSFVGEEVEQSLLFLNNLSLEDLKEKIIRTKANSDFWAEEERLMQELDLRIQPIIISEDINQLLFEEVEEKISEIKYWLWLFPKEGAEGGILSLDLYETLESKLNRLIIESKKPSGFKYSINPFSLNINELLFELRLIINWQSEAKNYVDVEFDVDLEFEALSYIEELNSRINEEYDDISQMSFNPEDLSDEAILGYLLNARKKLSTFSSANDENYIILRQKIHLLEVEANNRLLHVRPLVQGPYLYIEIFPSESQTGPRYRPPLETIIAPLQPENLRYLLEEMISTHGINYARSYIEKLKNFNVADYDYSKVNPYSSSHSKIFSQFDEATKPPMGAKEMSLTCQKLEKEESEQTIDYYQQDEVDKVSELAQIQFDLLVEENENFLSEFKNTATHLLNTLLTKSESDIKQQMEKYKISEPLSYYVKSRQERVEGIRYGSHTQKYYSSIAPSEKLLELENIVKPLLIKQGEIEKLKKEIKGVTNAYSEESASRQFKEGTDSDWQLDPVDTHKLLIQQKEYEFAVSRAKAESDHPILAAYAKGEGYNLYELESINSPTYTSKLAEKLYGHLIEIQQVRDAIKEDELNIWTLEQIVEITKEYLNVIPGSVRDKFINEKVENEKPSRWKEIAIGLITVGLALLAAIPTGGSSLAGVVAGGAMIAGTVLDVYLLHSALKEYNLKKAMTGTHYDKAKAISQEEPSLFWLAFQLVTTMVGLGAAAKSFSSLAKASKAIKGAESVEEVAENVDALRQLGREANLGDDAMRRLEEQAIAESREATRAGIEVIEQIINDPRRISSRLRARFRERLTEMLRNNRNHPLSFLLNSDDVLYRRIKGPILDESGINVIYVVEAGHGISARRARDFSEVIQEELSVQSRYYNQLDSHTIESKGFGFSVENTIYNVEGIPVEARTLLDYFKNGKITEDVYRRAVSHGPSSGWLMD